VGIGYPTHAKFWVVFGKYGKYKTYFVLLIHSYRKQIINTKVIGMNMNV